MRTIRRLLNMDTVKTLVNSFVASRIDYCNSLFYGATDATHKKLQSVLNAAARLITGQHQNEHISETLKNLHWLRVPKRITYKVGSLTRRSLRGAGPEYLQNCLVNVNSVQGRSSLRSATRGKLLVPHTRTRIGERSFGSSGPYVWNSLPTSLRCTELADAKFPQNLKLISLLNGFVSRRL